MNTEAKERWRRALRYFGYQVGIASIGVGFVLIGLSSSPLLMILFGVGCMAVVAWLTSK